MVENHPLLRTTPVPFSQISGICACVQAQVLTTGFWPTYKAIELALPKEMVEGVEMFKEFYEAENKHRCAIFSGGVCPLKFSAVE